MTIQLVAANISPTYAPKLGTNCGSSAEGHKGLQHPTAIFNASVFTAKQVEHVQSAWWQDNLLHAPPYNKSNKISEC
jgi:hypothetical protein